MPTDVNKEPIVTRGTRKARARTLQPRGDIPFFPGGEPTPATLQSTRKRIRSGEINAARVGQRPILEAIGRIKQKILRVDDDPFGLADKPIGTQIETPTGTIIKTPGTPTFVPPYIWVDPDAPATLEEIIAKSAPKGGRLPIFGLPGNLTLPGLTILDSLQSYPARFIDRFCANFTGAKNRAQCLAWFGLSWLTRGVPIPGVVRFRFPTRSAPPAAGTLPQRTKPPVFLPDPGALITLPDRDRPQVPVDVPPPPLLEPSPAPAKTPLPLPARPSPVTRPPAIPKEKPVVTPVPTRTSPAPKPSKTRITIGLPSLSPVTTGFRLRNLAPFLPLLAPALSPVFRPGTSTRTSPLVKPLPIRRPPGLQPVIPSPIARTLPTVGPRTLLGPQQLRQATQDCVEVKRARRRGKCYEGFFEQLPGRTRYTRWRQVDCVTRKTVRTFK